MDSASDNNELVLVVEAPQYSLRGGPQAEGTGGWVDRGREVGDMGWILCRNPETLLPPDRSDA